MTILDYFPCTPGMKTPRKQQIDVLEWFERGISAGKRKFIICAPTGSGKSGIAKGIANYAASMGLPVLITSPLNTLVDQYREFEADKKFSLHTLTGKRNYQCIAMREIKGEDKSCEDGFCEANICSMEFKESMKNPSKLKLLGDRDCSECIRDDKKFCPCNQCNYRKAYGAFKESLICNTNFTMLQMGVTNHPEVVIIDECDYMEPFIRMFRKVTIDEYWKFDQFDDYVLCLEAKLSEYKSDQEKLDNSLENTWKRKRLTEKIDKIERLLEDVKCTNEKYIVSEDNGKSTPFEPVNVNRFIDRVLDTENRIVVLMSATAQKLSGWEFIEVESPFEKEIRPFEMVPIGSMALKERSQTIPKLAQFIRWDGLTLGKMMWGKTIVHVPSYAVAEELGRELSKPLMFCTPIVQTRADTVETVDGATLRNEVIEKFKSSPDPIQILIAVNMGRGIDLPELNIKNNIITYIKRGNPIDHLTRAKWKYMGKEWEYEEAANEIMQQYGRVNRNNDKYTRTVITEPEFGAFFQKHKKYFRNWFIEAVVGECKPIQKTRTRTKVVEEVTEDEYEMYCE